MWIMNLSRLVKLSFYTIATHFMQNLLQTQSDSACSKNYPGGIPPDRLKLACYAH